MVVVKDDFVIVTFRQFADRKKILRNFREEPADNLDVSSAVKRKIDGSGHLAVSPT